jgi:hypothetical protein
MKLQRSCAKQQRKFKLTACVYTQAVAMTIWSTLQKRCFRLGLAAFGKSWKKRKD